MKILKKRYCIVILFCFGIFLSACSTQMIPRGWEYKKRIVPSIMEEDIIQDNNEKIKSNIKSLNNKIYIGEPSYSYFKKTTNLHKSYKVYKNQRLLLQSNKKNTRLKIKISSQRIRLYVNNRVALDSPCTTGSKHKLNPLTHKYENLYTPLGSFKILEKNNFKKNWMKITNDGIALYGHSRIKRFPSTNGSVYLPYGISNIIFQNVHKGTTIEIVN